MSKDNQIEEMAKATMKHCEIDNQCGTCYWSTCNECLAEILYNAGYHKQSENTVEVVRCKECRNCEKVPSILGTDLYCNEWCKDVDEDTFCSFGAKTKGGAE